MGLILTQFCQVHCSTKELSLYPSTSYVNVITKVIDLFTLYISSFTNVLFFFIFLLSSPFLSFLSYLSFLPTFLLTFLLSFLYFFFPSFIPSCISSFIPLIINIFIWITPRMLFLILFPVMTHRSI